MTEDEVFAFVRATLPSVWTLELLLLFKRSGARAWRANELVQELRSSSTAIAQALTVLHSAGLIAEETGTYRYQPASPALDDIVADVAKVYSVKPMAVIQAIVAASSDKLRIFANSFKLKD